MPSSIVKNGKRRYRPSVMVNGVREFGPLTADESKDSYREAVAWEKMRKAELQELIDQDEAANDGRTRPLTIKEALDGATRQRHFPAT